MKWITRGHRSYYEWQDRLRVFLEVVELPDGRLIDDYLQMELGDLSVIFGLTVKGRGVFCEWMHRRAELSSAGIRNFLESAQRRPAIQRLLHRWAHGNLLAGRGIPPIRLWEHSESRCACTGSVRRNAGRTREAIS